MKKKLIVALVCLNAALLLALMLGSNAQPAKAQALRGGADYLLVTGKIGTTTDAVYVIDLAGRKLAAWRFDKTRKRPVQYKGRDLVKDFKKR